MNVPVIPVFYFKDVLCKITDFRNTVGFDCERVYVLRWKTSKMKFTAIYTMYTVALICITAPLS